MNYIKYKEPLLAIMHNCSVCICRDEFYDTLAASWGQSDENAL